MKREYQALKPYFLLWSTQSLSALGSGMTSYALMLWLYLQTGSALKVAALTVCSYAPYVLVSIFAGAFSDSWNKKHTMLVCDLIAASSTAVIFLLLKTDCLCPWHLYAINMLNGLMNTFQQPASEVAATLLIPKAFYQKTSGLRSFSQALNTVLTPIFATVLFSFWGITAVIIADLATFAAAFFTLWLKIQIPEPPKTVQEKETILSTVSTGLTWLWKNPVILTLILFLACINLVASVYNAALPAMILPKANGGKLVLGTVNTCVGIASLCGSLIAMAVRTPKDRIRVICLSLFLSMSTENFFLAFGKTPLIWCIGAVLGWLLIPLMNANMDVIFRSTIPQEMQGRIYACRNTMQFFTIPTGYLLGGALVDHVFEPYMKGQNAASLAVRCFGYGSGAGAAMLFFVIGIVGIMVCCIFSLILQKQSRAEAF